MQSNSIKFTFISLNLFILIFFILLASKAAVNNDLHPIQNIFRSFRGESIDSNPLIVLSAEEQRILKARQYFQEQLQDKLKAFSIEPVFNRDKYALFDLKLKSEDMLYNIGQDLPKGLLLMLQLLSVNDDAYGYKLSYSIIFSDKDLEDHNVMIIHIANIINRLSEIHSDYDFKFLPFLAEGNVLIKISLNEL